ncbi:MAG TPA: HlyU family transcriptional regulator [Gammaproteobacteria bacterium]|nr:HlyU family transcriptional regulator [Gammaproteobacteria bacterium]
MIFRFLKNLTGTGESSARADTEAEAVEYKGFHIAPAPMKDASGWRVAAVIYKDIDGERCTHHLIRADVFSDRGFASELSIRKAKMVIDDRGEKILEKPPKED